MIVIAHRGASGYAPENTLRSFSLALQMAPMIELDVQVCKSGELIVFHDDTIDRFTSDRYKISEVTFKQIHEYKYFQDNPVPQLFEVIELVNAKIPINIEIKMSGISQKVIECLQSYFNNQKRKHQDFVISSFHISEIEYFFNHAPNIPRSLLFESEDEIDYQLVKTLSPISVSVCHEFLSQKTIQQLHSMNIQVLTYTVNSKERLNELEKLGVDGVFSNYPDLLLKNN